MSAQQGPVLVLTGTDHHAFDRLVGWADSLARTGGATVVVQHGSSRVPSYAEGHAFLDHDRLVELLDGASAVVCHGGPGLISDARRRGHRPVCVPRDPARGEHVDGHQLRFAAVADRAGLVRLATTEAELVAGVAAARAEPRAAGAGADGPDATVLRRLAGELDALVGTRPRRRASVVRHLRSRAVSR